MTLRGKLSILRPHDSHPHPPANTQGDSISLRLEDATSSVTFLEIDISLEAFMYALTGSSHQDCAFTLRGLASVGKRREVKHEVVPYQHVYGAGEKDAKAAALAPFEVDGWRGYPGDLGNFHRGNSQGGYRVSFTRFVEVAEPQEEGEP